MCTTINRYIFKAVFSSFLIVVFTFCVIFLAFIYIGLATDNNSNLKGYELVLNTLYQLPSILYILLPACAMVGSLMGLSLLANNSEIIILQSSGLSNLQISKGVIALGLIGGIITLIFGGYVAPELQKLADSTATLSYNSNNMWFKTAEGFINIKELNTNKREAYGIQKFFIEDSKLKEIVITNKAKYFNDNQAIAYEIKKLSFPQKNAQKKVTIVSSITQDKWSNPVPISVAKIITINNKEYLNFNDLISYMFSKIEIRNTEISLKFWKEVFQPISLIVLVLISVPLSIGSVRSLALILKFFLGVFFGFMFFIINQIFGPISLILDIPPIIGAAIPTIIAIILLAFLLKLQF